MMSIFDGLLTNWFAAPWFIAPWPHWLSAAISVAFLAIGIALAFLALKLLIYLLVRDSGRLWYFRD